MGRFEIDDMESFVVAKLNEEEILLLKEHITSFLGHMRNRYTGKVNFVSVEISLLGRADTIRNFNVRRLQ